MGDPKYLIIDGLPDPMDEVLDEHHPDKIFPDLDEDCRPSKMEWAEDHTIIELGCGCRVGIMTGDTIWTLPGPRNQLVPIAVEPVTIH